MTIKKSRSYILQTVVSKNGSWNNDFNHSPKSYNNQYYASDRALKYSVRYLMEQMGKDVFIKKWIKGTGKGKKGSGTSVVNVMTSKELKEHIKKVYKKDFSEIFWTFDDVRQFGLVYDNIDMHGVVQISQGLDFYKQGVLYADDLTGRMVFESKSEKNKETRGMATREMLSEAHFVYDISVNPKNIAMYAAIEGYEQCVYTQEDYKLLLTCLEDGPRNVKSTQKTNCYTGFMLQIDLKEDEKTLIGDLQGKLIIEPEKINHRVVYDISAVFSYLANIKNQAANNPFEHVAIKYDSSSIQLKGIDETFENVTIMKL